MPRLDLRRRVDEVDRVVHGDGGLGRARGDELELPRIGRDVARREDAGDVRFHRLGHLDLALLDVESPLGDSAEWGLDIEKGEIKVTQTMETNIPGIFAAGDITTYPGKLKLIATGAAEAAIAVNHAVHFINPAAKIEPGHSSNMAIFGQTED